MFNLSFSQKITICFFCFILTAIGFMVKLPSVFRHHDSEMHLLFYFCAAAFLNLLFQKRHLVIFLFLFFFGIFVELFQGLSRHYFPSLKHGRFDKEDLKYNVTGLILFSIIWMVYKVFSFIYQRIFKNESN
jgi:hypothetical protein